MLGYDSNIRLAKDLIALSGWAMNNLPVLVIAFIAIDPVKTLQFIREKLAGMEA